MPKRLWRGIGQMKAVVCPYPQRPFGIYFALEIKGVEL